MDTDDREAGTWWSLDAVEREPCRDVWLMWISHTTEHGGNVYERDDKFFKYRIRKMEGLIVESTGAEGEFLHLGVWHLGFYEKTKDDSYESFGSHPGEFEERVITLV